MFETIMHSHSAVSTLEVQANSGKNIVRNLISELVYYYSIIYQVFCQYLEVTFRMLVLHENSFLLKYFEIDACRLHFLQLKYFLLFITSLAYA